jgi:hypothetical protein
MQNHERTESGQGHLFATVIAAGAVAATCAGVIFGLNHVRQERDVLHLDIDNSHFMDVGGQPGQG